MAFFHCSLRLTPFFLFLASQPVFSRDDFERDPQSSGAVHWHGAGCRAEPHPAAAGQRGVPLSRHRHQPAAHLQGHPGTRAQYNIFAFFCQIRCAVSGYIKQI